MERSCGTQTRRWGSPQFRESQCLKAIQYPLVDYDLGPHFRYADQSGVLTKIPVAKGTLPQLVVRVDADGNEVAGIKSPLLSAPLGTYTGWNVTTSGLYEGQLCGPSFGSSPIGGFIPFARDKGRAQRERRSATVARRAIPRSRRLRAGGENCRRQARARWVSPRR